MQILFDTRDFPPRWHCGNWTDLHGWIHIVADVATGIAYFAIPAILIYFIRKREGLAFRGVAWLFALFILSCGSVHLVEATIFWWPIYRVSALFKALTAIISIVTAIALTRILPRALQLPGMAALTEKLQVEVAQRERTEEALRDRNYELDQFAGMASHDLKAPLHSIRNFARWIEEDSENSLSDESLDLLSRLQTKAGQMDELLGGLLDFTRAGAALDPVELDLTAEARATVELLTVPPDGTVEVGSLPVVTAQRGAIRLILRNVMANAIKHAGRPDVRIRVRGRMEGTDCLVEIEDNGQGIAEEYSEEIFDIFTTLQSGRDTEGSGMGLAAVRRATATLGGRVWVEPTEGGGATFVVQIPHASNVSLLGSKA
ncbi:Phytochrome-like protein cph1 [Planctomycetes bacterium Poly30]|uniref:histidine kinase n=1 Tax=Saltatorellus ferox TaxID=2528018 RepID=A0A518EKJ7_9BACT|nr:Phytochrome-like protein cph1 [Planctomycetes bacterium Poly30]